MFSIRPRLFSRIDFKSITIITETNSSGFDSSIILSYHDTTDYGKIVKSMNYKAVHGND